MTTNDNMEKAAKLCDYDIETHADDMFFNFVFLGGFICGAILVLAVFAVTTVRNLP